MPRIMDQEAVIYYFLLSKSYFV